MIVKASPETVVVGSHVLKEGVMIMGYVGYAGVVTRVVGQRVYHQKSVEPERWSHLKSMRFVADCQEEAESFKDSHNHSLTEVKRKVDGLHHVLMAEHAAMINAKLGVAS